MQAARVGTGERSSLVSSAWLPLLVALLIALDRFVALGRWSLWIDEVLTLDDYRRQIGFGHVSYPVGFWAIGATVRLLGGDPDAFALRLLPAVAGFACVPLTWWALRPLAGSRCAAFAALLVAASPWALFWSQNARFYTLALLISLLGTGLVVRGLVSGGIVRSVVGIALCASACLLQPTAILPAGALALAPTILSRWEPARRRFEPRVRWALLVLLGLGLVVGSISLLDTWRAHVSQQPIASPLHFIATTGFYMGPVLLASAAIGTVVSFRRRDACGVLALVICALVLSCLSLLSLWGGIAAQYAFVLLPWVVILATRPLPALSPWAAWGYIALVLAPAVTDTGLYFTKWEGNRPRWRAAFESVLEQAREGDVVLTNAPGVGRYYVERRAPGKPELRVEPLSMWQKTAEPGALPTGARAWIVYRTDQGRQAEPNIRRAYDEFLRERSHFVGRQVLVPSMGRDLSIDVFMYRGD